MAKIALLIGVSEYEPGLPCLDASVRDIEALRRVLQDPEMGGFDEVKILANPEAHTMQIEIETLFGGRAKDDLVLLFFSGHGVLDAEGTLYFASRNTRKNVNGDLIQSTAVETRFVHKIMNNSPAKRQAIILDCCYSGAFDPTLQPKDDSSVDLLKQLGAEGRVVLTSSSSTERSFEQQGADLSIYTRYLVEGIETGAGDQNSDGFVSMLELHEYAASKVRETAPTMTPKIIVMKDKGFEIVLAKAKVTDPKLKYRKMVSEKANAGTIRPAGRAILDMLRQQLGLTLEEATEIEAEVLRPYQERLANLQQYRETLIAEAEHEYPLSKFAREDLITLQQMLGLRDEDISPIQQEVEAQFARQSEAYQQHLVQYEQALIDAIQREFPFSQQTRQELENLKQSLNLSGDDIARIERPHLEEAELKHQERLRQEAERQQQEQEKAEYENNIRRYEQEFRKALNAEYPLSQNIVDELKHLQIQLGLKTVDPLKSTTTGIDYTELRNLLRDNQWKEADQKTTELINKIVSMDRDVNDRIPIEDGLIIDRLWVGYSNGQYGFSVQRKVWKECGSPGLYYDGEESKWEDFADRVGWRKGRKWLDYSQLEFSPKISPYSLPFGCLWQEYESPDMNSKEIRHNIEDYKKYNIEYDAESRERIRHLRWGRAALILSPLWYKCYPEEVEQLKEAQGQKAAQTASADELASEKGIDYTKLRDLLQANQWKDADRETRLRMLEAAGREDGNGFESEKLKKFPCADLQTIDCLWMKYSNGRFGFSVQKRIWQECHKETNRFCVKLGWRNATATGHPLLVEYSNLKFDPINSPDGELPISIYLHTLYSGEIMVWSFWVEFLLSRGDL